MHNLLLYVEENLIFTPEQCYAEEINRINDSNKKLPKKDINVPLISPQSTLNDMLCKPLSKSVLSSEQKVLPKEENMQDQVSKNYSLPTRCTSSKRNTNPFLQDEPIYDQFNDNISPHKFMQLWNENLKVQMQITATLNILLSRVIEDSAKNVSGDLKRDEDTLNVLKNILLHINKQMSNIVNMGKNTTPSISNAYYENNTIINNDLINVGYPAEHPIFNGTGQQRLSVTSCSRNHSFQNNDILSPIRSSNLMDSDFSMVTNNDVDKMNQSLTNQEVLVKPHISPEADKFYNKFNLNLQNCSTNNIDTNLTFTENPINNQIPLKDTDILSSTENSINNQILLKETNPFRLSLIGKLRIPGPEEEDAFDVNRKSVIESDLIKFEDDKFQTKYTHRSILEDHKKGIFDQYFALDPSSNVNTDKNNSLTLNTKSLNHNWDVNDITNAMSKIIIDNQPAQYNVYKNEMENHCSISSKQPFVDNDLQFVKKIYKQEPIHASDNLNSNQSSHVHNSDFIVSREISNSKSINENFTFPSNYDLNNCSSFNLPTYNVEHSLLKSTTNTDEDYLMHNTLYSSPSVIKFTNKMQHNQKSVTKNLSELSGTSGEAQGKILEDSSIQSHSWNKIDSMFENNKEKIVYDRDQEQNSMENIVTKDMFNIQDNVHNMGIKSYIQYSVESELKTVEKDMNIPKDLKAFFQVVELPKQIIHIFHYKGEGWLLINEFIEIFTGLNTHLDLFSLLHIFKLHIQFEEIDRAKNPVEFVKTGSTLSKATQDIINATNKLNLLPIKSALIILNKLNIISQKDINDLLIHEKFSSDSIVCEIWLIFNTYRRFRCSIESGQ